MKTVLACTECVRNVFIEDLPHWRRTVASADVTIQIEICPHIPESMYIIVPTMTRN